MILRPAWFIERVLGQIVRPGEIKENKNKEGKAPVGWVAWTFNPSAGDRGGPEAYWPSSLAELVCSRFSERSCLKKCNMGVTEENT